MFDCVPTQGAISPGEFIPVVLEIEARTRLHLGRFPCVRSVRPDQSALILNARVLGTGSSQNGPAHGSEPFFSRAPVGQIRAREFGELWREKRTGQNQFF